MKKVPKQDLVLVLDRSGSMSSMIVEAITGLNGLVAGSRGTVGGILFDDKIDVIDRTPVNKWTPLDATSWVPRGMTALLDAVCTAVSRAPGDCGATCSGWRSPLLRPDSPTPGPR